MKRAAFLSSLGLLSLLVLFDACQNPLTAPHTLTVNWTSDQSKTILPQSFPKPATYSVTLQPSTGSAITKTGLTAGSWKFADIPPALYAIKVQGLDSGGAIIVQGEASCDTSSNASSSVSVSLNYIAKGSGTGQIHLSLDFSSTGFIPASASLTLVDPSGNMSSPALTLSGSTYTYARTDAPLGSYTLTAKLVNGGQTSLRTETLMVFQGLDTAATIAFAAYNENIPFKNFSYQNTRTATDCYNNLKCVAFDSTTRILCVGTNDAGLLVSVDGGSTWSSYTTANGLIGNYVQGVAVSESTIYVATSEGLSISIDGGSTWKNHLYCDTNNVMAIGSTILAATSSGLDISTNDGNTWTNYTTANGLGSNGVNGVAVSGSAIYAATDGGLSVSINGGSTWTNYTTANGLSSNYLYSVAVVGSTIYVMTNNGLSISENGGSSWTNYWMGGATDVMANGSTIYGMTGYSGLNVSANGGTTWTNYTTANGLGSNDINGVAVSGSTIYAATWGGLSISTDGGSTWTNRSNVNGLVSNSVKSVAVLGSTIYAATDCGLAISKTGGSNWKNITTANGLASSTINCVLASGSNVYAATSKGLSVSTDGGSSWINYTTSGYPVNDIAVSGSTICAATYGGLSVSTNNGNSWTNYTTAEGLGSNFVNGVAISDSTICAATEQGVSISTDRGNTWTNFTTANGLVYYSASRVAISGSTIYAVAGNGDLSISTNGGNSWARLDVFGRVRNALVSDSTVYIAGDGIRISSDGRNSWMTYDYDNGLGSDYIYAVTVSGSTIYAATSGGLSISQ
jgi:BNR/Asp-box repeat.